MRLLWLLVGVLGVGVARGQGGGCVTTKNVATCNLASFQAQLRESATMSVEVVPRNELVLGELREMRAKLGKREADAEKTADLHVVLMQVQPQGILLGPAGEELARLRVYGRGGELVWAETLSGQPDLPWAAVAREILLQFEASAGAK